MADSSDAIAAIVLSLPSAKSLADPAVSAEIIGLNFFLVIKFWHCPIACAWLLTNFISLIFASGLHNKLCSTAWKCSPWICNLYFGSR